jgi:hypothetical protein
LIEGAKFDFPVGLHFRFGNGKAAVAFFVQ